MSGFLHALFYDGQHICKLAENERLVPGFLQLLSRLHQGINLGGAGIPSGRNQLRGAAKSAQAGEDSQDAEAGLGVAIGFQAQALLPYHFVQGAIRVGQLVSCTSGCSRHSEGFNSLRVMKSLSRHPSSVSFCLPLGPRNCPFVAIPVTKV